MVPREYWAALGSFSALRDTVEMLRSRNRTAALWDPSGTQASSEEARALNADLKRIMLSDGEIVVDHAAMRELEELVSWLHERGVRIVAVVPPTEAGLLARRRAELGRYTAKVTRLLSAQDLVVDFNGAGFESFRSAGANYKDGVHLTRQGAARLVQLLDERLAGAHLGG